jgi:hypothetical protein
MRISFHTIIRVQVLRDDIYYVEKLFELGDLVFYVGEPILWPPRWDLIVSNTNGIVSFDEMAIIIENDSKLEISTLFFQINQIEIPRISYKFLKHVR